MGAYKEKIYKLIREGNLVIPNYQRPYKWTKRNVGELLTDISRAIEEQKRFSNDYIYRIGTILLHNDKGTKNIVDGQQRIITMCLVCMYLDKDFKSSLVDKAPFSNIISKRNICDNYAFIRQWFSLRAEEEKKQFLNALQKFIEVIVIEVDNLSEAFQLFDSQNSRGKALYPHDLLKAYHLREMSSNLSEMEHAVRRWEDRSPGEIKELFDDYIFPICNWSKRHKTESFSDRHIDVFKGADLKDAYTFAMRAFKASPYFQITEPYIAGNDFFEYVGHYSQLLRDIKRELKFNDDFAVMRTVLEDKRSGLKYCKTLFYCALLCYYDRFRCFDAMAVTRLFTWAFMIRVDMQHLGADTINKYAVGDDNAQYSNIIPVFSIIASARRNSEIADLTIECRKHEGNWDWLYECLKKLNGLQ